MYEYLEGRVAGRTAAGLVLEVAGVAYALSVPLGSTFGPEGEQARVWTHLYVREDLMQLFGFPTRDDRELFRTLLVVRGVGPAMALAILSGLPRAELLRCIREEDAKALQRIKGVGRKTAEQIVLDLRDRADALLAPEAAGELVPRPPASATNVEDAVAALVSIGFSEREATRSVERAAREVDPEDLELLVKTALQP